MLKGFDQAGAVSVPNNFLGWRAILSACWVALLFAALFMAAYKMASRHHALAARVQVSRR
jgi:hypothetical protein